MQATDGGSLREHGQATMRGDNKTPAHNRRASVLRWCERLFVIAGIVMLGWCTLVLADSGVSQWQARRSLEAAALAASVAPPRITGREFPAATRAPKPHRGSAIGALSVPKVALSAIVLHDRRAPCAVLTVQDSTRPARAKEPAASVTVV